MSVQEYIAFQVLVSTVFPADTNQATQHGSLPSQGPRRRHQETAEISSKLLMQINTQAPLTPSSPSLQGHPSHITPGMPKPHHPRPWGTPTQLWKTLLSQRRQRFWGGIVEKRLKEYFPRLNDQRLLATHCASICMLLVEAQSFCLQASISSHLSTAAIVYYFPNKARIEMKPL